MQYKHAVHMKGAFIRKTKKRNTYQAMETYVPSLLVTT